MGPSRHVLALVLLAAAACCHATAGRESESMEETMVRLRGLTTPRVPASLVVAPPTAVVKVPTPDGVELQTYVWLPDGCTADKKCNAVIERTPYGAHNLGGSAAGFTAQGCAFIGQDFRGRYNSTGSFQFWRYGAADMQATVAVLATADWFAGKVATVGASADGIAQYVQIKQPVKQLVAQAVTVGTGELQRTVYQQGAYRNSLISGWLTFIGEQPYISEVQSHEPYSTFWDPLNVTGSFGNVSWPSLHISGWYDIFNRHTLAMFNGYTTQGSAPSYMLMLPTGHCGGGAIKWQNLSWGTDLSSRATMALINTQFGIGGPKIADVMPAKIVWYVMGPGELLTSGNYWTAADEFPTPTPSVFYLDNKNKLSTKPAALVAPSMYLDLPGLPIQTIGGNNLLLPKCGPQDQKSIESRPDVLSFTSEVLVAALPITGVMKAHLFVSSNCSDTDFVVKVTDVFPDGTSMLVQDAIIRMRWRDGPFDLAAPMASGTAYNVTVEVGHTSYIFNAMHKIRLTIQSSNFPRFDVNPNNGHLEDSPGPQIVAVNTVFHDAVHQSRLVLPQVTMDDLKPI